MQVYSSPNSIHLYKEVKKGDWNGTPVALKCLKGDSAQKTPLIEEGRRLDSVSHPHILQFMGFYLDQDILYMVTEYCSSGNLRDLLFNEKPWEAKTLFDMAHQIANAMTFLEEKKLIHRDLSGIK